MNQNPYLAQYQQNEVERLLASGSIIPKVDSNYNLMVESNSTSLYSSSISIPLKDVAFDPVKVETMYDVTFTEL